MAMIRNQAEPFWQPERRGFSGKAERNVRDLSHASLLVFALAAVATGILACISLSAEYGIGVTSSLVVVAVLFPLLCGWLVKEQWRTKRLEERIRKQQANPEWMEGAPGFGDNTPAGLLIVSPDLRVHFANQTYLHSSLQEPEEVLGLKIQDVMPAKGLEDRAQALLKHSDPAASCCLSTFMRIGLAGERPVHITMARIAPQQGEDRILVVVEDLFQDFAPRMDVPREGYVC